MNIKTKNNSIAKKAQHGPVRSEVWWMSPLTPYFSTVFTWAEQ
ncbi:hypothetical protein [Desulfosediminicola sp.]